MWLSVWHLDLHWTHHSVPMIILSIFWVWEFKYTHIYVYSAKGFLLYEIMCMLLEWVGREHRLHLVIVLQTWYSAIEAITMKTLPKAVAVVLAKDKTNAGIYRTPRMQKKYTNKWENCLKCTNGWGFPIPQKICKKWIDKQGSHAGNEGYHNGHCQSDNFSQLLISMVLATGEFLFSFFVLFSYCPCDYAIHTGQDTNGKEDESDKSCRNKSSVRFHMVECRSPIQLTVRFIFVEDQFETVEIRCVDGDGNKPRA